MGGPVKTNDEKAAARRRLYSSPAWKALRRRALKRAGFRCEECGTAARRLSCHHVQAVSEGGPEVPELDGVQILCWPCHSKEHRELNRRTAVRWWRPGKKSTNATKDVLAGMRRQAKSEQVAL